MGEGFCLFPPVALCASMSIDNASGYGSEIPDAICSLSLLSALRPPSPSPCSSNPAGVNFRALRFTINVSTHLSPGLIASPQAGPRAALSSFTLIMFLIKSLTAFMLPGQTDGSRLVLIYEAGLHVLLPAIHSEFCELVEGEGRGGKKPREK